MEVITMKLSRISGWIDRFATCIEALGVKNAFKIFLLARISEKAIRITLPNGSAFYFEGRLDKGVVSHFYSTGYFIKDTDRDQVRRIIDAGANIGDETVRFLAHHPHAEVVAIEAAQRNYRLLEKNVGYESRAHLLHGGLWSRRTHLKVIGGNTNESFRVVETQPQSDSVSAWSVSDIMNEMGWDCIDILKMDIEGSEHEVFSNNFLDWIHKVRVFIFEVPDSDRPGTTQIIYKALEKINFNSFICGENLVLIRNDTPWTLQKVMGFSFTN